jgi:hypothetical protein
MPNLQWKRHRFLVLTFGKGDAKTSCTAHASEDPVKTMVCKMAVLVQ